MKNSKGFVTVLVTAPHTAVARKLAQSALKEKFAACANIIPQVESHYWWEGKIEKGKEVLLLFKTKSARLASLEKMILSMHPYDTPEFIVLGILGGNTRYLSWLANSI